jgi:uncharacterized membrane protein
MPLRALWRRPVLSKRLPVSAEPTHPRMLARHQSLRVFGEPTHLASLTMSARIDATPASLRRRVGLGAIVFLAILISLASAHYLTLNPDTFFPAQKLVYLANLGPLWLHVAGGIVALTIGPMLFARRLRMRRPAVHRFIGRVYLVSALAAGVSSLLLAPRAFGGPITALGLATLGVLLIATSTAAFVFIRRGLVMRHFEWMVRSYALTFAAVTFRLWLGFLATAGLPFPQVYRSAAWACWIINLLVAQLLISGTRKRLAALPARSRRILKPAEAGTVEGLGRHRQLASDPLARRLPAGLASIPRPIIADRPRHVAYHHHGRARLIVPLRQIGAVVVIVGSVIGRRVMRYLDFKDAKHLAGAHEIPHL